VTIQISGNAPGTGTNTPNGVQAVAGVPLRNAVDVIYDFVPATGAAPAATANRKITTTSNCNACHSVLGGIPGDNPESSGAGFHGGSRNNVEYCVVCHTDQRRFGRVEATFDATTRTFSGSTYLVDGRTIGNLPNMIHKTHLGHHLSRSAYNYADVVFDEVGYPQDSRNCQNCHSAATPEKAAVTPQGDAWKSNPSRLACGACHDGINFDSGIGITLADAAKGPPYNNSTGFNGKAHPEFAVDGTCSNAGCHGVVNGVNVIDLAHIPVTPPNPNNALLLGGTNANTNAAWIASGASVNRLPPGAIKVTYEISSVTRDATTKSPRMVFRLLQDGVRKDLNVFGSSTPNPATGQEEIWDNFMGAPSVYFVWSVPQDGIDRPAEFNASASRLLRTLWAGGAPGLTGPDANGFYTATLTNVQVPDNALMLTGGLGYSYNVTSAEPLTQTNLPEYPTAYPTNAAYQPPVATVHVRTGGLVVIAPNVNRVATGYTGRRAIVEDKRCNACHQELGAFTEDAFHGGQRNDGTTCSWCHTPNRTSSGWSADSTAFVHAIHGAKKRTVPYTWHASSTTETFDDIGYPGLLANCEQCHVPGSYDFANTASSDAVGLTGDGIDKRLKRTVGVGYYVGTVGGTTRTFSSSDPTCATFGTSGAQTDVGVFSLSPWIKPFANAAGDAATPNTGNFFGYGFVFNANAAGGSNSVICPLDGAAAITVAPQGTQNASPLTLVTSPQVTVCTGCHTTNLAISHMQVNGGLFYEPRSTTRTEQCLVCHSSGKIADTKLVHKVP
jgi:OmcA/MtrC family decaheme c-type cytochrome